MKCERCGHHLEDDELFCPRCGKAVFEEYMDDDDIWEHYKPDKDLTEQGEPAAATEEKPDEPYESEEAGRTEIKRNASAEHEDDGEETARQARQRKSANGPGGKSRKKDPVWLICGCILLVCLIIGVILGMDSFQKEDKEKKSYYARLEQEEKKVTSGENQQTQEGSAESQEGQEAEEDQEAKESQETQEGQELEQQAEDSQKDTEEQQEKEEETKKQEYFQMVDANSIDFSQFRRISVSSAEENSMPSSVKYDYSAKSAVDGDVESSWQEGKEGLGEGTGIKLNFDGNHKVRYLVLYLGNWRSEEMWNANARPAVLSISVGDSQKKDVEFSNEMKAFCLSFDEPVEASYISLYIQSGYGGNRWNDNCISEVEIYE